MNRSPHGAQRNAGAAGDPDSAPLHPRHGRAPRVRAGAIAAILYAALIYGFIFLPVMVLVLFSFQDGRFPVPPFQGFSLRWYEAVLADRRLLAALGNSVLVALASSALAVLLGFLAAYGHARFRLPAGALQRALIAAPLMVSYLIIGMGLLIVFNMLGVEPSLWTAGIGHVVINLPLAFAIVFSQMGAHQANAERAARDLGAREWQVLLLVTAPMLWPALFASFFLAMTFSWDEFVIAFLLTRFDVTLPVEIWNMLRSGLNPKTNAAGSLVFFISVALVLVLELVVLRRRRQA
jgi:spermidine/putrescine transport system permease protein